MVPHVFSHIRETLWDAPREGRIGLRLWGRCANLNIAENADVAQLVEHHLAKVRVAGSNPVIRSGRQHLLSNRGTSGSPEGRWVGREDRQRPAKPSTRVRIPYPPRAVGVGVARFLHTEEVTGSIPVRPTKQLVRLNFRVRAVFCFQVVIAVVRLPMDATAPSQWALFPRLFSQPRLSECRLTKFALT